MGKSIIVSPEAGLNPPEILDMTWAEGQAAKNNLPTGVFIRFTDFYDDRVLYLCSKGRFYVANGFSSVINQAIYDYVFPKSTNETDVLDYTFPAHYLQTGASFSAQVQMQFNTISAGISRVFRAYVDDVQVIIGAANSLTSTVTSSTTLLNSTVSAPSGGVRITAESGSDNAFSAVATTSFQEFTLDLGVPHSLRLTLQSSSASDDIVIKRGLVSTAR